MWKKSTTDYTNRMMSKSSPNGDYRIKITLNKDQYEQMEKIAKKHGLDIHALMERYIHRCIADYQSP